MECLSPVSYTHLDVYKRQDHSRIFILIFFLYSVQLLSNGGLVGQSIDVYQFIIPFNMIKIITFGNTVHYGE